MKTTQYTYFVHHCPGVLHFQSNPTWVQKRFWPIKECWMWRCTGWHEWAGYRSS